MSVLSVQGEQSTSSEILSLTNLTNLATSGASEAIRKTGATTFANVAVGSSTSFSDDETPTGSINDSNTSFTLANSPSPAASLILVLQGRVMLRGTEYTLSGANITFTDPPLTGQWLRASYRY